MPCSSASGNNLAGPLPGGAYRRLPSTWIALGALLLLPGCSGLTVVIGGTHYHTPERDPQPAAPGVEITPQPTSPQAKWLTDILEKDDGDTD
jgi:hypothetical protein